jgi:hypothetical protein
MRCYGFIFIYCHDSILVDTAKSIDVCIFSLNPPFLRSLLKQSTRVDDKFIFLYIHLENSLKDNAFVCTYVLIGSNSHSIYFTDLYSVNLL